MVDLSRHLLHRDTLAAASAIYKGMVKSSGWGALTTRTSSAPWTRGWHGASYIPGHLPCQPYLLCDHSSHSQFKCRLGGSPHRSSQRHWRGARVKQVSKMSSTEKCWSLHSRIREVHFGEVFVRIAALVFALRYDRV